MRDDTNGGPQPMKYEVVNQYRVVVETFDDEQSAVAYRSKLNDSTHDSIQYTVTVSGERSEATEANSSADSQETTMSYNFVSDETEEQTTEQTDQQTIDSDFNWGYGDHTGARESQLDSMDVALGNMMDDLDGEVDDDMMAVLEDASELVSDIEVTDFECSHPDCGLNHGHPGFMGDDYKHDIRGDVDRNGISGFNITDEFAEQMEFVPYCHCGANEAAMLIRFLHYMDIPMFNDQHEFESVLEMDPEVVNDIYRLNQELDNGLDFVIGRVVSRHNLSEPEVVPTGVRDDLEKYLERRRLVESNADKAPIPHETQVVINDNEDEILEFINE